MHHHDRGTSRGPALLRRVGALLVATTLIGVGASCSDDEEPPATSVTEDTNVPAASTSSSTPDGDAGNSGAEPGQDPEQIDPPGGTTPTPDADGSDNDADGAENDDAGDQSEGP